MIKNKIIKVTLIIILLFLFLNVNLVMAECPTCGGTGKVVCPNCGGSGTSVSEPNINVIWSARAREGRVIIDAIFENEEDIGIYGTPIAKVKGILDRYYTNSSAKTYFPPREKIPIFITIGGINPQDYNYLSGLKYVSAFVTLSEADGTTCLVCNGTGFVTCPDCNGTGIDGEEDEIINGETDDIIDGGGGREEKRETSISLPFDWTIIGIGGLVAVAITVVVVVRRKKVTEKDLRRLTFNEFQNWVVQRLLGKASSPRDSRIGIDAYTVEGYPIKIIQSDNISGNIIDNFASIIGRIKAKNGIVVAFSFSDDVYRGIARAKRNYRIEIKKVTVKELIQSREI